ncbi:MAG: thioredoxin-disulfide reductase [Bacteroidales bacterium]|nr:thioredoxin-disulfide reductase [Bacteroidales bacterium]MDY6406475.1 thioredoxin-disulfide reductase [Bacteroidales bacterium]
MENKVKCLIIGSGPAGYTAAIYASRANLAPVLIEGPQLGGQLTTTTEVENFPGYPDGVEPFTMMDDMRRQAERFGTQFVSGIVTKVDFSVSPKKVWVEDTDLYEADAVIIATGASAKYLGIESERTYRGRGVSACATCDGFFYRKKTVAVVGGGDTACEEANYLAGLCEKVYMIVRKPYLRASEIMQQRVLNNPKIEVLFEHNTLQLTGEGKVQGADLIYRKGEPDEAVKHIEIDGFFLAIGHHPNTELFKDYIARDAEGYIITHDNSTQCYQSPITNHQSPITNNQSPILPGVFAAGDCADPHYRQAIVAAGSGAKAAIEADKYIKSL